jgi:Secretion system C-terminal sorting domain
VIYSFFILVRLLRCKRKKNHLFCTNKSKFVLVRRILPIISFILLTAITSKGQSVREPSPEATQRIMKFYPNPATTFIKAEFQKNFNAGYSLQIINFIGKQVYEAKNVNSSTTLDLSSYSRGVYIYQLKDQSGKVVESGKFQVSK